MDRSTSLTAHLARAAGTRAMEPVEAPADSFAADSSATARPADDAEDRRCAASVISGQRCRRPAAEGRALCPGHMAMGTEVPPLR
jgi:hypothetical protein